MTKEHWAWALLVLGVVTVYSVNQFTAGKVDTSTTWGKIESELASVNLLVGPNNDVPVIAYAMIAVAIWVLWF
jgi:hypothetical protein